MSTRVRQGQCIRGAAGALGARRADIQQGERGAGQEGGPVQGELDRDIRGREGLRQEHQARLTEMCVVNKCQCGSFKLFSF